MKMKIQVENETYEVEIDDLESRPVLAKVNGETFEVFPEEVQVAKPVVAAASPSKPATAPVRVTPKPAAVAATGKSVVAPIPGVIDNIKVREGDEVKNGDELIVLEAMKMKNALRANRDGKIARIYVSVGDQVPHNHVLLDFAD